MGLTGFAGLSDALREKIAAARATQGGNKLVDGSYVLCVDDLLLRPMRKGTFFTAETHVCESAPSVEGVTPNAAGSTVSALHCNLDTNEAAAGNMRQCLEALLALDGTVDKYLAALTEYVWDGKDAAHKRPARGMLVGVETYRNTTKTGPNAGSEGTYPRFVHVPGQTTAGIAARRAAVAANRAPNESELADVAGK